MAMRNFYKEIRGMKVKDVPAHLKPMFTIDYVKNSIKRALDNYHAKYIQTSSIDPLLHVCYGAWFSPTSSRFPRSVVIWRTSSTQRSTGATDWTTSPICSSNPRFSGVSYS